MILTLRRGASAEQITAVKDAVEALGASACAMPASDRAVLVLRGDTAHIDIERVRAIPMVEDARYLDEPYPLAARGQRPDTVVSVGGARFGGGHFGVIAGPCAAESLKQTEAIARAVKDAGACMLRGGAFKPRTSPYAFQGLGREGIDMLTQAKRECCLPLVVEIMDASHLPLYSDAEMLQVGARNMQNFELLRALGRQDKPVLLKRGMCATLTELLLSAEYLLSGGNPNVVLCERGIRTFDTGTRCTLDISAVPLLKRMTHLPVMVDPSHASGLSALVPSLSLAAVAAGADGLMLEVHDHPQRALSDGAQALNTEAFSRLMRDITRVRGCLRSQA